jgi:hypothetical protein
VAEAKTKKKTGLSVLKIFLIILSIATLGLGVYAGFSLFSKGSEAVSGPEEKVKRNYVVLADSSIRPSADEAAVNSATSHDVKMNSTWTFSDGKAYSRDAFVENPSSNLNSVYFEITVSGYKEPIMTSPVLPVGSHLENITLDKALKAGTYNCTLTYTLLSMDGKESVGTLQMALKIIIQS